MDQRSASVIDHIAEKRFHRDFSQRRRFVQVADDLSAKHPKVVYMPADGIPGETG